MTFIWKGIDVDIWGPIQTFHARNPSYRMYAVYDHTGATYSDMVPDIPLEIRFASFCSRLNRLMP